MQDSGISRRSLFSRLFGGVALAAGAMAAEVHKVAPDSPRDTLTYTFDGQGRLLSVAYDDMARNPAPTSLI